MEDHCIPPGPCAASGLPFTRTDLSDQIKVNSKRGFDLRKETSRIVIWTNLDEHLRRRLITNAAKRGVHFDT